VQRADERGALDELAQGLLVAGPQPPQRAPVHRREPRPPQPQPQRAKEPPAAILFLRPPPPACCVALRRDDGATRNCMAGRSADLPAASTLLLAAYNAVARSNVRFFRRLS